MPKRFSTPQSAGNSLWFHASISADGSRHFFCLKLYNVITIMSKLTPMVRKKLVAGDFGMPKERKYPMPDASHAANAKARATQQVKAGNLSPGSKSKIDAKANKVLGKKRGG